MKSMIHLLFAALLALAATHAGAETPPDQLVKNTSSEVLEIVKNDKDIQAGNMSRITELAEEKILPHFDFERMSRMVLGKNWNKASNDQKDRFISEFRTLLIRTYASALAKYRNQTIDYKPLRADAGATDVTVKTQIIQPNGPALPVDYSLIKNGDAWKVYDISIESVSLVTNYRGQFSSEIRQSGLDGLIQRLADKNKQSGAAGADSKKQG